MAGSESSSGSELNSTEIGIPIAIPQIPIDLFISRKRKGLKHGDLTFTDSLGNLVFRVVDAHSSNSPDNDTNLLDATGNLLISISRNHDGWQGYRGDSSEGKSLIFRTVRTIHSDQKKELNVFLFDKNSGDSKSEFVIKGSPFQRSCTIYQSNSIVAQTSLLYKLRSIFVGRSRFRLTIFPGFIDHALVAALIVIFFHGRI